MKSGRIFLVFLNLLIFSVFSGLSMAGEGEKTDFKVQQEKLALEWRKERDEFFKSHQRSPLTPKEKKNFKGLKYYAFDPNYAFFGEIKRTILHINNPDYYATFLTNKGTNKRYIRYGKFHFQLNGKEHVLGIYKSILSDILFIPFKDRTNGKETYEGGRYIDAEILPGYKMVLDFNMAYHPSCAYDPRWNCPLAPPENTLAVAVPVGERLA